jgi:uncharacterized protein YpmS
LDFATGINSGNKEPVKWAALFDERVKKEELGIWNLEFFTLQALNSLLFLLWIYCLRFWSSVFFFSRATVFFLLSNSMAIKLYLLIKNKIKRYGTKVRVIL